MGAQQKLLLAVLIDQSDNLIGKGLPAQTGVRVRLSGADGQDRIQQQHALSCPAFEITVGGRAKPDRGLQLFIHIQQRRRIATPDELRTPDRGPDPGRDRGPRRE